MDVFLFTCWYWCIRRAIQKRTCTPLGNTYRASRQGVVSFELETILLSAGRSSLRWRVIEEGGWWSCGRGWWCAGGRWPRSPLHQPTPVSRGSTTQAQSLSLISSPSSLSFSHPSLCCGSTPHPSGQYHIVEGVLMTSILKPQKLESEGRWEVGFVYITNNGEHIDK